jgi:uncharacterized repeat protein (TIGR01451 family)
MGRDRSVRQVLILFAAAVLGLGTLLGGVALAEGSGDSGGSSGGSDGGGDPIEVTVPPETAPDGGGPTDTAPDTTSGGGGPTDTAPVTTTVTVPTETTIPSGGGDSGGSTATADLSVTKTDAPDPATTGDDLTYTIAVTNNGPDTAESVGLSDVLPAGVSFKSVSASDCIGTSTVLCSLGPIASGATVNVVLVVTVDLLTSIDVQISNSATATSPTADPDLANNTSAATTTVSGPAAPALESITVTPGNKTLAPGMTQQFSATGNYSDGTTQDLTTSATWSTGSATIATVSGGLVTANAAGTTTVSASDGGKTGSATVKVSPLRSIKIVPVRTVLATGETKAFTANGKFANGVTTTITDQAMVTWSSSNSAVATVSPQGGVTAVSPGTAQITATFGNVTGSASVRVK